MNEYSDSEFVKLREKVQVLEVSVARLQEQEKAKAEALVIAREALSHSQQVSNEWRKENIDQRALYPTTPKMEGMFATESSERRSLENRIIVLEKAGATGGGRHAAFEAVWVKFAAVAALVMTALSIVYKLVTGK